MVVYYLKDSVHNKSMFGSNAADNILQLKETPMINGKDLGSNTTCSLHQRAALWMIEPVNTVGRDSAVYIRDLRHARILWHAGNSDPNIFLRVAYGDFGEDWSTQWYLFHVNGGDGYYIKNRKSGKFLMPGYSYDGKCYAHSHDEEPTIPLNAYIWNFRSASEGNFMFTPPEGAGQNWSTRVQPNAASELRYYIESYPNTVANSADEQTKSRAFEIVTDFWNCSLQLAGVSIKFVRGGPESPIKIRCADHDNSGDIVFTTIARVAKSHSICKDVVTSAQLTFNAHKSFDLTFESNMFRQMFTIESFFMNAIHEFGHLLGLNHSDDKNSVMYGQPAWTIDMFTIPATGKALLNAKDHQNLKARYCVSADPNICANRSAEEYPDFRAPF